MKLEHMDCILNILILKRWTKNAKSYFVLIVPLEGVASDAMELAQLGHIG